MLIIGGYHLKDIRHWTLTCTLTLNKFVIHIIGDVSKVRGSVHDT